MKFCSYVESGDLTKVQELLDEKPSLSNLRARGGTTAKTPLSIACWYSYVDIVVVLLEYGADASLWAHKSNKDKTWWETSQFARDSVATSKNTTEAAKLMLMVDLCKQREDMDFVREIGHEGRIPPQFRSRFAAFKEDAKRLLTHPETETDHNRRAEQRSSGSASNPAGQREWQQVKQEQERMAEENESALESLRMQVQELKSEFARQPRLRSRSPRRDDLYDDHGYDDQGYDNHGSDNRDERQYVRQSYRPSSDYYR
jgi:flagellar biosynthesis GTPase FlhF